MAIPLSAMARRARKTRKSSVTLRPINAPATMASDLYVSAYDPVIKVWSNGAERIIAAYERALAQITQDSPEQVSASITTVENDLNALILSVRMRLEAWAAKIERWHRSKWRGAVLSATSVDLGTMLGAGPMRMTLGTAIERNVGLIKSVSDQARGRIGDAVFRGLTQRKPAREVASEIRGAVAMSRRRALNIAADQTTKLTAAMNTERMTEAGLDHYEWMSSHKVHYRPEHAARDGQRYEIGHFGDDEPGMAINCGCTARAVLSLDGEF